MKLYTGAPTVWLGVGGWPRGPDGSCGGTRAWTNGSPSRKDPERFLRHADGSCGRLTSYCSCGQWLFELHRCLWDFTLIFSGCLRITTMNAHYLTGLKYSNALRSYWCMRNAHPYNWGNKMYSVFKQGKCPAAWMANASGQGLTLRLQQQGDSVGKWLSDKVGSSLVPATCQVLECLMGLAADCIPHSMAGTFSSLQKVQLGRLCSRVFPDYNSLVKVSLIFYDLEEKLWQT